MEAALAGLLWAAKGHGYEITGRDIRETYLSGATAAANADQVGDHHALVRAILPIGNRAFADSIADVFPPHA